ncbi:MAG: HAD-IIB family hydrolase [Oscillospiraceae bacterium]|nr:HAD-IIB family hydrolase [Oscillospiraceae bacterium]
MVLFIDIDGTIRDYTRGIIPSAVAAMKRAREKGHILILCTGRSVGMIPKDVPMELFDGAVTGGGCSAVYRGEVLRDASIDPAVAARYRRYFEENSCPYGFETKLGIFMTHELSEIYRYALFAGEDPAKSDKPGLRSESIRLDMTIEDYDRISPPVTKLSFCLDRAQNESFEVDSSLSMIRYGGAPNGLIHCEMVAKHCDKGSALRMLCEREGFAIEDTAAFGDSMNDAAMFAAAGIAFCMGNGSADAKEFADEVSDTHLNGGFDKALKKIGI